MDISFITTVLMGLGFIFTLLYAIYNVNEERSFVRNGTCNKCGHKLNHVSIDPEGRRTVTCTHCGNSKIIRWL